MFDHLAHLEDICECALHVDLMLAKCQYPVAKAEGDESDDQLRDVILPPLIITLARLLASRFRRRAAEAIESAAGEFGSAHGVDGVAVVTNHLNQLLGAGLAAASSGNIAKTIRTMLQDAKLGAAHELGIRPTFSTSDERILHWMEQSYPWWIGEYHSKVLAKQINAIAQKLIIEEGRSGTEVANAMRSQLTRLYGVGRGEPSPVAVPRSFRGSPDQYWNGLASHAATTARVFGRLSAMREAGITTYVYRTAGDERVCELCRLMEGREFRVADGERQRDAILNTESPEEYLAVAGWKTFKAAKQLIDEGGNAITQSGLILPPAHYQCRCDLEAKP
jgi:hypothetical protein